MINQEERLNSLSHGIGVILGIVALVILELKADISNLCRDSFPHLRTFPDHLIHHINGDTSAHG